MTSYTASSVMAALWQEAINSRLNFPDCSLCSYTDRAALYLPKDAAPFVFVKPNRLYKFEPRGMTGPSSMEACRRRARIFFDNLSE